MKVLLISLYPPTRHNIGGPSSLPFYLAKHRPDSIEIDLFYYEGYEDRETIFLDDMKRVFRKITRIRQTPSWKYYPLRLLQEFSIFQAFRGISLKHLPRAADKQRAIDGKYDLIWIYTGLLYPWAKALSGHRQVMTGPDNLLLHHQLVREIYLKKGRTVPGDVSLRAAKKFFDFALHRERRWAASDTLLHVVGKDDRQCYVQLGASSHSFFSPHPYYDFEPVNQTIDQVSEKLTILVAGTNHSVYTGNYFDEVVQRLRQHAELAGQFRFLMIGRGFENAVTILQQSGFEVACHQWVDSYEKTIAACHIQFFPIILGTGTKGKVLCALATGLLCIGSRFAFENIEIDPSEDAVLLENEDVEGVVPALREISANRQLYAGRANRAAGLVRKFHAPRFTAELFWQKVISYWKE
jgi:hypothetical protein